MYTEQYVAVAVDVMKVVALDVRIEASSDRRGAVQIIVNDHGLKPTSSRIQILGFRYPTRRLQQMIPENEQSNFEIFRDCLSNVVIERLAPETAKPKKRVKGRKNEIKPVVQIGDSEETDANELSDFTEVCITILEFWVA